MKNVHRMKPVCRRDDDVKITEHRADLSQLAFLYRSVPVLPMLLVYRAGKRFGHLKTFKNLKSPDFKFVGFLLLVQFYGDHKQFHILVVICNS